MMMSSRPDLTISLHSVCHNYNLYDTAGVVGNSFIVVRDSNLT